jgi:hypothetical protein
MSILRNAYMVIELAERERPSLLRSSLWKTAKKRLLRDAVNLETEYEDGDTIGVPATGSLGEDQCDQGNPASGTALNDTLTKLLGKPPLGISPSSTESQPQKIVQLTRSTRLPRT